VADCRFRGPPSRRVGALALLGVLATATGTAAQDPPMLLGATPELYVNLTLIDGRGGVPQADAAILVWGGRIRSVGARSGMAVPQGTQVIDLDGAYVVPGFLDMDAAPRDAATLVSMLAAGITGVREAAMPLDRFARLGHDVPFDDPHPAVFVGGPLLEGPDAGIGVRIGSRDEVPGIVAKVVREDGAAFVSVGETVPAEWVPDIARTARADGATVWLERRANGWRQAIPAGVDAVVGLVSLDPAMVPADRRDAYLALLSGSPARAVAEWLDAVDPHGQELDALAGALLSRDAVLVPLLSSSEPTFPAAADPRALELARVLDAEGIRMAVGSGMPTSPASAERFHHEIELLVRAGIPPLRVLEMASGNGAVALGELYRRGTIEEEKQADFVVLEGDPLADIRNTRRIRYVVLGGEVWAPLPEGGLERVRFR